MSELQEDRSSCHGGHPHDGGEQTVSDQSSRTHSSPTPSASGDEGDDSAAGLPASTRPMANAAHQFADVQPLEAQMTPKPTPSSRFSSPLDRLAKVELQLCLQFLETKSRLMAARCSRALLQAADHPFVWRDSHVALKLSDQPQPGTLVRRSLPRHAAMSLCLDDDESDLSLADVAAIPHLRELAISFCFFSFRVDDFVLQLWSLPALQRLQTLRTQRWLPAPALRLLSALPALHTLHYFAGEESDWGWLPAMPALTDLHLAFCSESLPRSAIDAIGQCARLQSLGLDFTVFVRQGDFVRLCSTSALRRLRHLTLVHFQAYNCRLSADEYSAALSALAQLESLRLMDADGVDLLLPHLVHAPALRALIIPCTAEQTFLHGPTHPSRPVLGQLLSAAPLLDVRLEMAASIESWRDSFWYGRTIASEREQMDEQWLDLQRAAADLERVVIVDIL